jgi:hypothetical protein
MDRNKRRAMLEEGMPQFIGTTEWYRHSLNKQVIYTEGAQFVAETGGAYWLLDEIAIAQFIQKVKREPFQTWILRVTGESATLVCDDGNGNVVLRKHIQFTDFPLDEITLWFESGVIMLPSER